MKDELRWIRPALASKEVVLAMTYYLFKDGFVHAHNGRMTAAHPINVPDTFLVSGPDFEEVLNRLPGDAALVVKENEIQLKSGRYRGNIKTLSTDLWGFPLIEDEMEPIPADLLQCLKGVRPFISDNNTKPWALCACIREGFVYATNNITVVRKCFSIAPAKEILIPFWAIDFLLEKSEAPTHWCVKDHYLGFRWANGAFMRTQLVEGVFPEQVHGIISAAKERAEALTPCVLDKEWRVAYETVNAASEGSLQISPQVIAVTRSRMELQAEIDNPVTKDTFWDPHFFSPVIQAANKFYPDGWPQPCYFEGDYIDGVVVGRMN